MKKDYCSLWPDGNYGECCKQHDLDYTAGGGYRERSDADKRLRECVAEKRGKKMAWVMWFAVRIGGWLPHHFKRDLFFRKRD